MTIGPVGAILTGSGGMRVGVEGGGWPGGVMSTHQRHAPWDSLVPHKMGLPLGSMMKRWWESKCALQPVSQSWSRLRRLLVKFRMMCPIQAWSLGKVGRSKQTDAMEMCAAPVAVRIVVGRAFVSWWVTGAVGMK